MISEIAFDAGTVFALTFGGLLILIGGAMVFRRLQSSSRNLVGIGFPFGILVVMGLTFVLVGLLGGYEYAIATSAMRDLAAQGVHVDRVDIRVGMSSPPGQALVTVHSKKRRGCSVDFGLTDGHPYQVESPGRDGKPLKPNDVMRALDIVCGP